MIYPLGRSRFLGALLLLAWALAGLLTAAWGWLSASYDPRPWLGVMALLLAGGSMVRGWQRSPVGQLIWDGQHWAWESQGYRGGAALAAPRVVLDLQSAVLMRLDNPAGASWWLWAERSAAPPRWLDLRRAIYARPRPELPTDILANGPAASDDGTKVQACETASPNSPR